MSIILGIDPGSRITGYGVIRQVGRQLTYLAAVVSAPKSTISRHV